MMASHKTQLSEASTIGPFQIFILLLSIYVLIALFVIAAFPLSPDIIELIHMADNVICVFFLIDFVIRFRAAKNKWAFMKWGWIDLLSSIPMLNTFRAGRIFRVIRVLMILRAVRSSRVILRFIFRDRMQGTFALVSVVSIVVVIVGAIAILIFEKNVPNSNIHNAQDALWWAFVTITTVGYGDYFPITLEGRVVAAILMIAGVGLFGTFTGFIATWFVAEDEEKHPQADILTLQKDLNQLRNEVAELKELLKKNTSSSKNDQ